MRGAARFVRESELDTSAFTVVWHAGEPMVLPASYYREMAAVLEQELPDSLLVHSFQTNATLFNTEWIEFLARDNVQLGVSIDGPQLLNDYGRLSRAGKSTYDNAVSGIKRLVDSGIPFYVITVLHRDSLHCPDELFDFYVSAGIRSVAFNIEEIEGINTTSSLGVSLREQHRRFLHRFWRLCNEIAPGSLEVREFSSALNSIRHPENDVDMAFVDQQSLPWRIISVAVDGGVSTFSPELLGQGPDPSRFIFGNVLTDSLSEIERKLGFLSMKAAIDEGVKLCRNSCEYFRYCGGGAPANKLAENGSFATTTTVFCQLTKQNVLDMVVEELTARRSP